MGLPRESVLSLGEGCELHFWRLGEDDIGDLKNEVKAMVDAYSEPDRTFVVGKLHENNGRRVLEFYCSETKVTFSWLNFR